MRNDVGGIANPFLKWAGGKRWFCERHLNLLPKFTGRYIEPFAGGAALFFSLLPENSILSDINTDLITTYVGVKKYPDEVFDVLLNHQRHHSKEYYYKIRSNKPDNIVDLSAWFIYLNRTCWNGLYRVNKNNNFNVPIGTKNKIVSDCNDLYPVSMALRFASLMNCDFESIVDESVGGDFLFIDPPYTVKHNLNGFVKYNDKIFSWRDQIRLRDAVRRASERGVFVMVLNANHASIRDLYEGIGEMQVLQRASILAASPQHRSVVEELVVRCWLP